MDPIEEKQKWMKDSMTSKAPDPFNFIVDGSWMVSKEYLQCTPLDQLKKFFEEVVRPCNDKLSFDVNDSLYGSGISKEKADWLLSIGVIGLCQDVKFICSGGLDTAKLMKMYTEEYIEKTSLDELKVRRGFGFKDEELWL